MLNKLERTVAQMMVNENSANAIAKKLGLSIVKVNTIREQIYQKMEVKNQIGLVKRCLQMQIIKVDDLLNNQTIKQN